MRFYALIYFSFPLIPLHVRKKKTQQQQRFKTDCPSSCRTPEPHHTCSLCTMKIEYKDSPVLTSSINTTP